MMPRTHRITPTRTLLVGALLACTLVGCGLAAKFEVTKNPDRYHVMSARWLGDSVMLQVAKTFAPSAPTVDLPALTLECRSAQRYHAPAPLAFDGHGVAYARLDEAGTLLTARLRIAGDGIDTTVVLKQPSYEAAVERYHLTRPLTGRILIRHLAMIYADSTCTTTLGTVIIGDEMNLFGGHERTFEAHHPAHAGSVFIRAEDAVRID